MRVTSWLVFNQMVEQYKSTLKEDIKLSNSKCLLPIEDYIKSYPEVKEGKEADMRGCSACGKKIHYKNGVYFMIGNSQSIIICRDCIPRVKLEDVVNPKYLQREKEIYIWDLGSNTPHTMNDKLRIHLIGSKIYVEVNFNPSYRKKKI